MVHGPLDYTHILATVNNAAMDMGVKIFLQDIDCTFGYISQSGISGSFDTLNISCLRNIYNVSHNSYINL